MSYDETLAERCRTLLLGEAGLTEKRMFGGLSFLLEGKMACGVLGDRLVVRIDPTTQMKMLQLPHVSPMDFTGRPMAGFLYVAPEGCRSEGDLARWVGRALEEGKRRVSDPAKKKHQPSTPRRRVAPLKSPKRKP